MSFSRCIPFLAALLLSGCGYTLQNSKGSSLELEGVERVYVAPVKNASFKPGIENLVYNELIRVIAAGRRVRLVEKPELADAILEGQVMAANYKSSSATSADNIYPKERKTIAISVATEYVASVTCAFKLKRTKQSIPALAKRKTLSAADLAKLELPIWESAFSRDKRFPGNNQKGEFGTTSALINESEFDRALGDIAHGMMQDVHESMLAMF